VAEEPDEPGAESPPLSLDYFAAQEPNRRRARAVGLWSVCLGLGWVPYVCGIVNALVAAQTYSPVAAGSHRIGAALFLGLGLIISFTGLLGFVRLRHSTGIIAGVLLVGMQASVALCLGVSSF